jgi:cytochrome b561
MTTRDTPTTYGVISRLNHWIGALFVLLLLGIGLYFADMPRGPEKSFWRSLHIAFGTIAIPFLLFRVWWRIRSASPLALSQAPALRRLSRVVHVLLLAGIVVMVVSGPLIQWLGGRPFGIFDWVKFPSPLPKSELWHERVEVLHGWTAWVLLYLIGLHLLGVIKHQFISRDNIIARMTGREAGPRA